MRLRKALHEDRPALQALIARSARELSAGDYTPAQVEAALRGAFGVDTQLIDDGTYFVVEAENGFAGCGGWSRRRTMFGSDTAVERDAGELDPTVDAARIRAFFVDPSHARKGVGRMLLEHCESEARRYGFQRCSLMATLPGVRLYAQCGYVPSAQITYPVGDGISIEFVPMSKELTA